MSIWKEIGALIKKDFLIELRNSYAISGTLLYIFSTIIIVYFSFIQVPSTIWNAMLWIIILFISVGAISKSFEAETSRLQLYYYSIAHPIAIIMAKMAYNIILLMILILLTWWGFSFVTISPVRDQGLFFLALFLASVGFSITFTFISAIASKASGSSTLMAILSFPLVIPILTTLLKLSGQALKGQANDPTAGLEQAVAMLKSAEVELEGSTMAQIANVQERLAERVAMSVEAPSITGDIGILLGIDLLLIGLALVLFPILWKE